ncbi:MAG: O-antigen ligase family protein [Ignavibacteriales bacterium]
MRLNDANLKNYDHLSTSVLIFTVAVIPLIVHLKMIPVNAEVLHYWNSFVNGDFFSYYKSLSIYGAAFLTSCLMVIRRVSLRKLPHFIPMSILIVCVILSTHFSPHPYTSVHGFPDRYEGAYVLLSYIVLLMGASTLIKETRSLKAITVSLMISAAVIGTIGLFQYFGVDFYQTGVGRFLVDFSQGSFTNTVNNQSNGLGKAVYGSLYNPNAFGMYMSMLFPFTLFMALFTKRKTTKILLGVLACLLFADLLASFSRGSLIGAMVAVFITALLVRRRLLIHWRQGIGMVVLCGLIFFVMNIVSIGALGHRVESLVAVDQGHLEDQQIDKVKDFKIKGRELSLYCTKSVLKVKSTGSGLSFYDDNNQEIDTYAIGGNGTYGLTDDRYKHFVININNNLLKIKKGKSFLYFRVLDQTFAFLDARGEAEALTPVQKFGFKGFERIGSGRGYIWSRTLPVLSRSLIIGKGPDTFALEFPQQDYKGKLRYMYDAYIIIDKPHNMYLQTALNTGLVMLFAMLGIFCLYLYRSGRTLIRGNSDDWYSMSATAIFAAVVAYLISGLFTDSTVSVAPVFWVLLGLGSKIISLEKPMAPLGFRN